MGAFLVPLDLTTQVATSLQSTSQGTFQAPQARPVARGLELLAQFLSLNVRLGWW